MMLRVDVAVVVSVLIMFASGAVYAPRFYRWFLLDTFNYTALESQHFLT